MRKFFSEKWPEVLILVIIIPGFTWMISASWGLDSRLIKQEVRTESIIAALPDLRTRVAFESVYKPFASAVVVSKPFLKGGQWVTSAHLIDAANGTIQSYSGALNDQGDSKFAWAVSGSVMAVDARAITFDDMQEMATEMKVSDFPPSIVNVQASYVLYQEASKVELVFKEMGIAPTGTTHMTGTVKTWPELVKSLKSGEIDLR